MDHSMDRPIKSEVGRSNHSWYHWNCCCECFHIDIWTFFLILFILLSIIMTPTTFCFFILSSCGKSKILFIWLWESTDEFLSDLDMINVIYSYVLVFLWTEFNSKQGLLLTPSEPRWMGQHDFWRICRVIEFYENRMFESICGVSLLTLNSESSRYYHSRINWIR